MFCLGRSVYLHVTTKKTTRTSVSNTTGTQTYTTVTLETYKSHLYGLNLLD